MKKFSFGSEPQFALIMLLVGAPIFLGLCVILLGWIDAAFQSAADLLVAPAEKPWIALLLLLWLSSIANLQGKSDAAKPDDEKPLNGLFLLSIGALIGLSASRFEQARPASLNETLVAYAAMGIAALHLLLLFTRPSPKVVSVIEGALLPVFLGGLLTYVGVVQGEAVVALSLLGAVVTIIGFAWLAGKRTDQIDYGRR